VSGRRLRALWPAALLLAVLWSLSTNLAAAGTTFADDRTETAQQPVVLTLFHGEGCPHCAAEITFLLDELAPAYPSLQMQAFEVWNDADNRALLVQAAEVYGFDPGAVPVTIVEGPIGYQVFVGFGAATGEQIVEVVERELAAADQPAASETESEPVPSDTAAASAARVDVPLVGTVDLSGSSLLVATVVIGFVDGINPCSLWVLSVLLAIVLHSGSRGRVVLVGGVFLTVTAAMYAVYVAGVYSVLTVLDGMVWIRVVVALVALVFGAVQLSDGLQLRRGPSLSISAARKPSLYQRMRAVGLGDRGIAATIGGTVVLAVGVSLLETPCTAGLPLLWAGLVADAGVSTATAVALFGIYMLVFLVDELAVFTIAVVTLRSLKLQQNQGQALKIVSGSVLVTLAVAMIALPEAMRSVPGTLAVFAVAVVLGIAGWLLVRARSQDRTQRVSSVPSSARARPSNANPRAGSADRPDTMRRASPPTSAGTTVQQSSSSRPVATTSPRKPGPPSHSNRE
jgi:cytochrome c biogenesis protein CcdA